jgi:hypothetical protein
MGHRRGDWRSAECCDSCDSNTQGAKIDDTQTKYMSVNSVKKHYANTGAALLATMAEKPGSLPHCRRVLDSALFV